jgi:hypothetical protein
MALVPNQFVSMCRPTVSASAARHRPDRQWSKLMLNLGSWAGRLHAVLGGTMMNEFTAEQLFAFSFCDVETQREISLLQMR